MMGKKRSVISYEEQENSKEYFLNDLRINFQWNELKYQEMIRLVKHVIEDYAESDVFPKSIRYFFTSTVDDIVGIVSNDLFFRSIPDGFSKEDYISFIDLRKRELLELKEEFFYGEF